MMVILITLENIFRTVKMNFHPTLIFMCKKCKLEINRCALNTNQTMEQSKRAYEVNVYKTFILNISLFLELAGCNLAQTLLNPSKVIWHQLFLLNVSVVFVNAEKCRIQNRVNLIKQ